MIIKKYLAKTEQEAIELAKKDLGSNAVVMNIKKVHPRGLAKIFVKSKVEVTAALEDAPSSFSETSKPGKDTMDLLLKETKKAAQEHTGSYDTPHIMQDGVQKAGAGDDEQEQRIQDKIVRLQTLLEQQKEPQPQTVSPIQVKKPGPAEPEKVSEKIPDRQVTKETEENEKTLACKELVRKQLIQNEVEEEIADSIMDEVNRSLPVNASLDQILGSVYQKIILMMGQPYVIDAEAGNKTKYVFFLGSTGVGKTTTIAKIASKLKLEQKLNLAMVTADTYRIAAVEQLKTYANILSVPLKVVYSPDELGGLQEELSRYDVCLIDTAGCSHKNKEQIADIQALIEQIPITERQVYLVLNSGTKYSDLKQIAAVYSRMTDFSIIFTKMDETSSAGVMLNMRLQTKCPLSYVTWGQNVPDDIGEINAQTIAKKLLGDNSTK